MCKSSTRNLSLHPTGGSVVVFDPEYAAIAKERDELRQTFADSFVTAESGGEAGYCIKAKFASLSQMQNAHSALVRLLQSVKAGE